MSWTGIWAGLGFSPLGVTSQVWGQDGQVRPGEAGRIFGSKRGLLPHLPLQCLPDDRGGPSGVCEQLRRLRLQLLCPGKPVQVRLGCLSTLRGVRGCGGAGPGSPRPSACLGPGLMWSVSGAELAHRPPPDSLSRLLRKHLEITGTPKGLPGCWRQLQTWGPWSARCLR